MGSTKIIKNIVTRQRTKHQSSLWKCMHRQNSTAHITEPTWAKMRLSSKQNLVCSMHFLSSKSLSLLCSVRWNCFQRVFSSLQPAGPWTPPREGAESTRAAPAQELFLSRGLFSVWLNWIETENVSSLYTESLYMRASEPEPGKTKSQLPNIWILQENHRKEGNRQSERLPWSLPFLKV